MRSGMVARIRWLSFLALLLALVMCVVGVLLVITNPGLILLYVIAGIGLICGAWLLLSSRGRGVWWGLALAGGTLLVALAATCIFFSQPKNFVRLVILVVASVLYLALTGYIAQSYWRVRRSAVHPSTHRQAKPFLIVNPKSGNGRSIKARVPQMARSQGIEVAVLRPGQDMVELTEDALKQGANVIGVSGGDGSLGIIAAVAIKHDVPMVVLPGGTRCHFARDIGLDPKRIVDALAGFYGAERRVDVGLIGDRVFLNNASFGLYAEITSHKEYREHKLKVSRRIMRQLAASTRPYYPIAFRDGAGNNRDHAAIVLVGVNRYDVLHVGELGERKRLDEGILQIIALSALDGEAIRQLATRQKLFAGIDSRLQEWTTTTFIVSDPSGWLNVGVDGENLHLPSPTKLRIAPKALRLLVPAEGVRHRPIKPISTAGVRTLWQLVTGRGRGVGVTWSAEAS